MLVLLDVGGSIDADESKYGRLDIMLTLDTIDLYFICEVLAQKIASSCPLQDVQSYRCRPGYHKITVLDEGEILDHPILGLGLLVLAPLIWGE